MSNFGTVWLRRIILIIISLVAGTVGTFWLVVQVVLDTTWDDYGVTYVFFTLISIAIGVAILLDHERALNTQILPH